MRAILLDIDGTTLLGAEPLPGAVELVTWLREHDVAHVWITNNTSRSRRGWLDRLANAGLEPTPRELYTAGDATIDWLRALETVPPLYVVGTRELEADFRAADLPLVDAADAEMLVLGYDTELTYEKLRRAALLLRRGARYVATHPDVNCPTPEGPIPDVGSFMAMLRTSTGRTAEVIGKPHPTMARGALTRLGVDPEDAVVVGDRLETDMRMARDAGLASYLVLSGVTAAGDVEGSDLTPTAVFPSLVQVYAHLREGRR